MEEKMVIPACLLPFSTAAAMAVQGALFCCAWMCLQNPSWKSKAEVIRTGVGIQTHSFFLSEIQTTSPEDSFLFSNLMLENRKE